MDCDKHIARLVLGYLRNECKSAYKAFVKYHFGTDGKFIPTRVAGQTLADILKVHSRVNEIVQGRLENTNYFKEHSFEFTSPNYLVEQLLYLLDRIQYSPASTSCSRTPSESDDQEQNETICNANTDIETTPEYTLPGNINYSCGDSYFSKSPKRKPSHPRLHKSTNIEAFPTADKETMSEVMTQRLLQNRELHEKLANTINTVLNTPEACSRKTEDETEDGVSAELNATIRSVLKKTEEDPIFEDVLQEVLGCAPIVDNISRAIELNTVTSTYLQSNNIDISKQSHNVSGEVSETVSSVAHASHSSGTTSETSDSNRVIVFDGTLDKYLKASNSCTTSNQINSSIQNPVYINTMGGLLMVPSKNMTGIQFNSAPQYYVSNQPVLVPQTNSALGVPPNSVVVPQFNPELTKEDILAMPTVIVTEEQYTGFDGSGRRTARTVVPKPTIEIPREYLTIYDTGQELATAKTQPCGLKRVIHPAVKSRLLNQNEPSTSAMIDSESLKTPKLDMPQDIFPPDKEREITQSISAEPKNAQLKTVESELTDSQAEDKEKSEEANPNIVRVNLTSTPVNNVKIPTPKSGSHVRNLDFSTPPKITSTTKKIDEKSNYDKKSSGLSLEKRATHRESFSSSNHKMKVTKTLFKSKNLEAQIEVEEEIPQNQINQNKEIITVNDSPPKKPKKVAKRTNKGLWDGDLRALVGFNAGIKSPPPRKKKKSPPKPRRKVRKIVKVELNTTDQEAKALEDALKTPVKLEKDSNIEEKCGNEADKFVEARNVKAKNRKESKARTRNCDEKTGENSLKKVLSPSKLIASKKNILKTESSITSNEITPEMPKEKVQHAIGAKRNINCLLDKTPIKENCFIPKTPGMSKTPGVASTPFTPLLEANLKGIKSGNFSIDTPDIPLTPGFSLGADGNTPYPNRPTDYSNSSSYYVPSSDNEQNKSVEVMLMEENQNRRSPSPNDDCPIHVLSNVTVKPPDLESRKEKNHVGLSDHLKIFNKNVIGKKNLNLMKNSSGSNSSSSSFSSTSSSESSSSEEDEESNKTVICAKKHITPVSYSYSLRERKPSIIKEPEKSIRAKKIKSRSRSKSIEKEPYGSTEEGKNKKESECNTIEKHFIKESQEKEQFIMQENEKVISTEKIVPERVKEEVKTVVEMQNNKITDVLRNAEVKKNLSEHGKSHKDVLKEMEEKRKRTLKALKSTAKSPVKSRTKFAKAAMRSTRAIAKPYVPISKKNKRKSDSPKKLVAKKIDKKIIEKTCDFMPDLSSDEDDEKIHKHLDEVKGKHDKSSSDVEAQTLIEGLKERGIHLVFNKSPQKNIIKQTEQHEEVLSGKIIELSRTNNKQVKIESSLNKIEKDISNNLNLMEEMNSKTSGNIVQENKSKQSKESAITKIDKSSKKHKETQRVEIKVKKRSSFKKDPKDTTKKVKHIQASKISELSNKEKENKKSFSIAVSETKTVADINVNRHENAQELKETLDNKTPESNIVSHKCEESKENVNDQNKTSGGEILKSGMEEYENQGLAELDKEENFLPDSPDSELMPSREYFDTTLYKKEHKHIIYDDKMVISKTLNDYNLEALYKSYSCTIFLEQSSSKIVHLSCSPFQVLLDIPSTVNVLIPRRKRLTPTISHFVTEKVHIDKTENEIQTVKEGEKIEQEVEQHSLGVIQDANSDVDSPLHRLEKADDELMNYAIIGSEREENADDSPKFGKKRKNRTDSSSSNSLHADKKARTVDYQVPKDLDVNSFLNMIHGNK